LIGAAGAQTRSYTWDLNGNRQNDGDVTDPGNRVQSQGSYQYTYDDEGNRQTQNRSAGEYTIYEWDYRNRLTRATIKASSAVNAPTVKVVEMTYDVFDRRVSKTVTPYNEQGVALTPVTEFFVYDEASPSGIDNVLFDFVDADGAGASETAQLKTRYLHGSAIDQISAQEDVASGGVSWLIQDRLGSVRDVVNNAGQVVNRIDYDGFGRITSIVDPRNGSAPLTAASTRYGFTGQEYDRDLDLHFYNARWYDAKSGTFLSPDPMSFAAGDANLYRYVGNDPTNMVDPTGKTGIAISPPKHIQDMPEGPEKRRALAEWKSWVRDSAAPENFIMPIAGIWKFSLSGLWRGIKGSLGFGDDAAKAASSLGRGCGDDLGKRVLTKSVEQLPRTAPVGQPLIDCPELIQNIKFGQRGISSKFAHGEFAGMTIDDVAKGLHDGSINASKIPIQSITRDGVTYTLNNRSLMALRQAGLDPTIVHDVTGNAFFEEQLTKRLKELQMPMKPDFVPRIRP